MCVKNVVKGSILLILAGAFFGSCEAIDNILPSAGTYKINVQVNGILLDECSYIRQNDKINLSFEEPVSDDPDVTTFMVFLKNSSGEIAGWKVIYTPGSEAKQKDEDQLIDDNTDDNEEEILSDDDDAEEAPLVEVESPVFYKNGDELIIPVLSLDDELPSFPIPGDLAMGRFTLVSQVMSGKDVLQRTEKNIFYLGKTAFSYKGINSYLPGAADTSLLIPRGTVVMLEADLDFDSRLDPYIVWYEGKNKINEGKFSDGAECLFWKAPEQSGFYAIRAEIFPVTNVDELSGYKKEISLLVSTKTIDMHLVSANNEQLTHWYVMEGDLCDSKTASAERALRPASGTKPKWMGKNGTYGIATGYNNILMLPKLSVADKKTEIWQALFRYKLLNDGNVFSVKFGSSGEVSLGLYMEGKNLILILTSPFKTVSQTINLSEGSDESSENIQTAEQEASFLTAGIKFSIQPGLLSAQINIFGNSSPVELAAEPITLEAEIKNEFNIMLGFSGESSLAQFQATVDESESSGKQVKTAEYTVLWDEFALYYMPPPDILDVTVKPVINEDKPVIATEN